MESEQVLKPVIPSKYLFQSKREKQMEHFLLPWDIYNIIADNMKIPDIVDHCAELYYWASYLQFILHSNFNELVQLLSLG